MRKYQNFALLLCSIFFSLHCFAQQPLNQINILSFNVKNKLPTDPAAWGTIPAGLLLTAQRIPQTTVQGIKLVLQIKQGGAKICGNNTDAAQIPDFTTVRTFSGGELTGLLGNCQTLKPGSYSLCAQFFNIDRYPISKEICKEFVVEDAVAVQQSYNPPQNINPVAEKNFSETEAKSPVTFRWTPVLPKPKEVVTYRLKVWQLMQGQNGSQAMRSNPPIVTKDVDNITQAVIANIYTGPCKPPYLCDYVWNVQALDKEGKPLGNNNGTSELTSWSFGATQTGKLKLLSPENKSAIPPVENASITFRWTPLVPKPQEAVTYRLKVWQLMQGQNGSQAMRSNKPIVTKDVADITEASISNIYTGPCKPPYLCDYVWEVQALNKEGKPIETNDGVSDAFNFKLSNNTNDEATTTPSNCAIPVINFPENGKAFTKDTKNIEIKGFLNGGGKALKLQLFKISDDPNLVNDLKEQSKTASVFSPLEMFDYSGTAKKINAAPKNYDVKTERSANNAASFSAIIPTAELEPGSYYITVQNANCVSTAMAFSMSAGCGTNLSTVTINCKAWVNGIPTYTVSIVFNNIPPLPGGQNCTTVMNSIVAVTGSISGLASLPVTIPSGGSAPAVTFTYTPATATQTSVNFNYFGIWNDGFSNTSNFGSGAVTLPSCVCNSCKDVQWNSSQQTVTVTGNNFNILQPLNIAATGLGNIVAAKAEIIAFERYVGDSCVGCNKDYTQWGNFTSATYAGNNGSLANATAPVSGNTTHSLYWNASGGGSFPANSPFNLNITTPVLSNLTCCCDRIAVTIRYTFSFKNGNNGVCKMCSFIKRYEYKKGNCPNVVIDTPTDVIGNPTK
jgi:hypothetical protein